MNKCHHYLSNGLWEIVKCQIRSNDHLQTVYFWGMAVSPHHLCFASHIRSTPWQQSWSTLQLLQLAEYPNATISNADLQAVREEVNVQYTLRNLASEDLVQVFFEKMGRKIADKTSKTEICFDDLLRIILKNCPSTAHTLIRQAAVFVKINLNIDTVGTELSLLFLATRLEPPSLTLVQSLMSSSYKKELFYLLMAKDQGAFVSRLEHEELQLAADAALTHLEQLVHNGIQPLQIFQTVILSNRHFILYLLDMLEIYLGLNTVTLPDTPKIPSYLWPLLLLRLWGKPDISEAQIQSLIQQCKETTTDQALVRVCFMLDWYLSFSHWSAIQGTDKPVGLEAARDHSVLHLIHASADLAECDWEQVRALLHEPWDIHLLDAFSVILLLLRALLAAAAIKADKSRLCNAVEAEVQLAERYGREVTSVLKRISETVRKIAPIRFQLEVLENLFAILFITYEDLKKVNLKPYIDLSSENPAATGFVSSPNILRDTVHMLRDCVSQMEGESRNELETLPCSIKTSQIENRMDRLSESLSEAVWRLQLVMGADFVSQTGSACCNVDQNLFQPEWLVETVQEQVKSKRRSHPDKREDSGSQSPGGGTDRSAGSGFMQQMIASDGTLVVRCLAQRDLLNAEHIITMMVTEEIRQVLEGELNYTRGENEIRKKLASMGETPTRKQDNLNKTPSNATLQAVQQVAAEAVSSSALTSQVERFLSVNTLPVIQGSSKIALGSMLQCIENSSATVILDLAITATTTYRDFRDLLSLASKHCPELTTPRHPSHMAGVSSSKPLGYIAFTQTLMPLLNDINKELQAAPDFFFRTRHTSFVYKLLKDQEIMWKTLANIEREVANDRDGDKESGKSQKIIKNMQKVFENLTKAMENSIEILDLGRVETGSSEMAKHVSYADLLNRYLSDLATLSLDFVAVKSELDEGITFHSLLNQSAVEVLDKLIFQHKIDPALLEKKAQQLGFNLGASLLWGCAPAVPQGDSQPICAFEFPENIVLNNFESDSAIPAPHLQDIVSLVSCILSDLFIRLKEIAQCTVETGNSCCDKYMTVKTMTIARVDPQIHTILTRTDLLRSLDLPDLEPIKLLTFYVNLTNLVSLHCVLHPTASAAFLSDDNLVHEASLSFVGYHIGDGFISLARLQSMLCGEELGRLFLSRRPRQNVTVESDPRALFLLPLLLRKSPGVRLTLPTSNETGDIFSNAIEAFSRRFIVTEGLTMTIPPLLDWYLDTVLLLEEAEGSSDGSTTPASRRLDVLLEFLMENSVSSEWRACVKAWSLSDLILRVSDKIQLPNIILDYCWHAQPPHVPQINPNPPADRRACWQTRSLTESILKQLSSSSRLLTDLVVRLHEARGDNDRSNVEMGQDVLSDERLRRLDALLSAPWLSSLAPLFGDNAVLASLHKGPSTPVLWSYLNSSISEKCWAECWTLLSQLPDFIIHGNANLRRVRDLVLYELTFTATQSGGAGWSYSQLIYDVDLRVECILSNYVRWPGDVAVKIFSALLCDEALNKSIVGEIHASIQIIKIFSTICVNCEEFGGKSWFDVWSLSVAHPSAVLQAIKKSNQTSLFFEWITLPGVLESIEHFIDVTLIILLATVSPSKLIHLSSRLPYWTVLQLCDDALKQLKSLPALRCIAELCLKALGDEPGTKYHKILLGVEMLSAVGADDLALLMPLVSEPLLILELLLMNTRLDTLELVLRKLRSADVHDAVKETEVSDLLTQYASRAVHLDVIRVVQPTARQNYFVPPVDPSFDVPDEVPDRSQWVPDNQVSVCMCCLLVTFSMFNRRHHCRRCGRVVCATCSAQRLKINRHPDVPVRVCRSCFGRQTKPEADAFLNIDDELIINNSVDQWRLSIDPVHNDAVRAEFSYENSPNAALCLAIFNLVPDSPECTSRLLDESEKLLEILQGRDTTGNPEVDYPMLIQIIRALVIGAKVRYGKTGLGTGVVSCDRLLSQVDVVSLLVKNHCTRLIPPEPLKEKTMRALRDRLLEEELWELAIEFSTKAGFSVTGVWASWGKMLLAAGCWQEARIKLSQCLVPSTQNNRSSPLLDEICDILESTTFTNPRDTAGSAMEVLELLGSLKAFSNGKLAGRGSTGLGSPQYVEQEWYLMRFGNASSLLKFYLRKQQWATAIGFVLQRQLDAELFNEFVLLPAYRTDCEEMFKSAVITVDPTWLNIKRYLTGGCLYLQKMHCLHYLHDLQVFMQDFVRASMTCIQLYQSYACNYSQLHSMTNLLQSALRHLEQEIAAASKKNSRLDFVMQMDEKDITRHMNTIWRQLEISKYLAGCEALASDIAHHLTQVSWTQNQVPTLFDGSPAKSVIAALCVIAGKNVEEAFGLAFRIIQDNNLDIVEVMSRVSTSLGAQARASDIQKLIHCINTSGVRDVAAICDQVLLASVKSMSAQRTLQNFETIAPLITSVDTKIHAFIAAEKLKSAYLLAVKHNKIAMVETIMAEAERAGQTAIRDICRKKLGLISETQSVVSSTASSIE